MRQRAFALALAVLSLAPTLGAQQARQLTLDDALHLAAQQSEVLQIARNSIERANGQVRQARSQYLPQVNTNLTYARTLKSQFSALAGSSDSTTSSSAPAAKSVCAPTIPANATAAEKQAILLQATTCPAVGGIDFSKTSFGARNNYNVGFTVAQNVFTGGRVKGQTEAAVAGRNTADIDFIAQRAQLALDVTQAYFDAVLADRLVLIADTSLAQTEELLRQTTVARRVGNLSEFDLLRATVTRDNQRPIVIQRRGDRDVAYFRLKQLLNLPLDAPLQLTTPIDDPAAVTSVIARNGGDTTLVRPASDTTTENRAPVRESNESVRASEGLLKVARSELFPSLSINTNYQRLFFPPGLFPSLNQYTQNWTVGGTLNWNLFSGGRVLGEIEVAQANLSDAKSRLQQARELAALDTRVALNQLASAEAAFIASRGTAEQARRAYSIDQLRFTEGLSTQTDLTQSRLLQVQAEANQAQSARDLAVARARVALIRDLPIDQNSLGAAAARSAQAPQTTIQQQQRASAAVTAASAGSNTGTPTP